MLAFIMTLDAPPMTFVLLGFNDFCGKAKAMHYCLGKALMGS